MTDAWKIISAKFSQEVEDGVKSVFCEKRERVLRWLVTRWGIDIVQRPHSTTWAGDTRATNYAHFYSSNFFCGIICISNNHPANWDVFANGWFVSDANLAILTRSLLPQHRYGLIMYLFESGDLYVTNLGIALQPLAHKRGTMMALGGSKLTDGIYIRPDAFSNIGNIYGPPLPWLEYVRD